MGETKTEFKGNKMIACFFQQDRKKKLNQQPLANILANGKVKAPGDEGYFGL